MAALDPAVAAIRAAVRSTVGGLPGPAAGERGLLLVACSGGADSMALAAAVAFVAPRLGWRAGLVTVDHQLQYGSAGRAEEVVGWAERAGLTPATIRTVMVAGRSGGPEAAAREARYEALTEAAAKDGASAVLLGHTEDDQAETVLLAMLRGAGPRGLAGMPVTRILDGTALVRPLLGIPRAQTRAACAAQGITFWEDPHNTDPSFGRSRTRGLLQSLVDSLGPAVVPNLARTARLAAIDTAALDELAALALLAAGGDGGELRVERLVGLAEAVRTRALHAWARRLGVPGSALSYRHVVALDDLVTAWRGQGPVHLPGAITVVRRDGVLRREDG